MPFYPLDVLAFWRTSVLNLSFFMFETIAITNAKEQPSEALLIVKLKENNTRSSVLTDHVIG